MRTLELAAKHAPHLVALRRALHEIPETGLDLPLTQETVLRALEGLDLEVSTGESLSSVVAVLRGGGAPEGVDRRAVLLRGDMDALPVTEDVDLPYRSRHEGRMHACGHDLHAAALVGAARILAEMREEVAGDVVFMFQPAEEGPGGARRMLEEGLLEVAGPPVEAAYALHVSSSEYPRGHWYARPGVLMAAVDRVNIRVQGAGGHGSEPHRALDPIPVLCEIVLALQTMVTRTFDPFDSVVLTVGKISAGFSDNVIPDSGDLAATLRTFSAQTRETAGKAIGRVASGVAAAHGLSVELDYSESYPATVNDDEEYTLRPGPDQCHLASHDIPQLRQFIEMELAKNASQASDAVVAIMRPLNLATRLGVVAHGPQLNDLKRPAVQADTLLQVETRPARR